VVIPLPGNLKQITSNGVACLVSHALLGAVMRFCQRRYANLVTADLAGRCISELVCWRLEVIGENYVS
jgi:hypothetical protein